MTAIFRNQNETAIFDTESENNFLRPRTGVMWQFSKIVEPSTISILFYLYNLFCIFW